MLIIEGRLYLFAYGGSLGVLLARAVFNDVYLLVSGIILPTYMLQGKKAVSRKQESGTGEGCSAVRP